MALIVPLFASVALAQQGDQMGRENEMQPEDRMMGQEHPEDQMMQQGMMTATASASSTATAAASPTASATATPTAKATASPAASALPDTGGPSRAAPIALAAALALVGSGVGALALARRRVP